MNKFYKAREIERTTWKDYAAAVFFGILFAVLFSLFI